MSKDISPDIIWQTVLDGIYDVTVEGIGSYSGLLKIREGRKLLMQKPVTLSYGAMFGPDIGDVAEWERMACEFVDNRK